MDRNGNVYTILYASVMVIAVAAILAVTAIGLKPFQKKNIEIEKKQSILASVNIAADATTAENIFAEKIVNSYVVNAKGDVVEGEAFTVDLKKERAKSDVNARLFPVFECQVDGSVKYILPMYGAGLWGPIWGYVSIESDMKTIFGATFDHAGETPGLGAEISTDAFEKPFSGKKIFDADGKFTSIIIAKSNETAPAEHKVDAISGGTITSKGLQQMLLDDLSSYKAFLESKK